MFENTLSSANIPVRSSDFPRHFLCHHAPGNPVASGMKPLDPGKRKVPVYSASKKKHGLVANL
jgi:hypothetical protein